MDIHFSNSNRVHITNTTDKPIHVIAAPDGDWLLADFTFSLATTLAFPPAGVTSIKTLSDLYTLIKLLKTFASLGKQLYQVMSSSDKEKLDKELFKLRKMFKEHGKEILPGQTVVVNEKALISSLKGILRYTLSVSQNGEEFNKEVFKKLDLGEEISVSDFVKQVGDASNWLNPSTFTSVFSSVSDLRLIVADCDFERVCSFSTNSDHSWIVKNDGIVRAEYNTLVQEAPNEGRVIFSKPLGISLESGMYLEPGQSIEDDYFIFVYQLNGNLVLYEKDFTVGTLKKVLWISGTEEQSAWRTCMEEDGNVVVYSEPGKVAWAWKQEMPSGYHNSLIKLDTQLGLVYYKNGHEIMEMIPFRELNINDLAARELYKIKSDVNKEVSKNISNAKELVEETITNVSQTELAQNVSNTAYAAAGMAGQAALEAKRKAEETASKIAEGAKKLWPW